jgi:DNA invertase Pin-like site-specific DNA recombinase
MNLIAYYRVSRIGARDKTSESFQTVKQQRKAAKSIVALMDGARIIDEVEALNASGGKTWPEPKLDEVIERVDRGEADGVVVYDLSRWGRHFHALEVIERWANEGKVFVSASEKFDAATPTGRMVLRMMMLVARWYWEQSKDRFEVSQHDAVEAGKFIGPTPFGYLRDEGRLYPDPDREEVVSQAFKTAAHEGIPATVTYLQAEAPEREWTTDSVRKLLASRVYLGEVWMWQSVNGTKARKVTSDAHVALTDLDIWTAAQHAPKERRTNGDYILSGIARCATCGGPLVGQLQTTADGRQYRRYRCGSRSVCRGGSSINGDKLEAHVIKLLAELLSHHQTKILFVGGVAGARDELSDAEAELDAFVAVVPATSRAFASGYAARERAVEKAQAIYAKRAAAVGRSVRLPDATQLHNPEQFKRALRVMVDHIDVQPGRGTVEGRTTPHLRLDPEAAAEKGAIALIAGLRQRYPGAVFIVEDERHDLH